MSNLNELKLAVGAAKNIDKGMNLFYSPEYKRGTNVVSARNCHVYIFARDIPTYDDLIQMEGRGSRKMEGLVSNLYVLADPGM